jgi:hypothetical protein
LLCVKNAHSSLPTNPRAVYWHEYLFFHLKGISYQARPHHMLCLSDSFPGDIKVGFDGNLWFSESETNKIGRITPSGQITEFPIPTPNSSPQGLTRGPDGNVWFTEFNANGIGSIIPS